MGIVQWARALAVESKTLVQSLRVMWWREKTNFCTFSSGLQVCDPALIHGQM